MRRTSLFKAGVCAVAAAIAGWSAAAPVWAQEPASQVRLEPEDVDAFVGGLVRAELAANRIPGASLAVTQDDRIVLLRGYGYADVERAVPVDPRRHLFRVASVSKPFVWMSVLQARDRGLVDLDQDINAYLDFTIPDTYPGQPITLRHLLTHTAGFEDRNIGASVRTAAEREPLGDTVRRMLPRRTAPPGQRTAYSNYGAALAGYIVERVARAPFPEYLEANIFRPLGMARTSMYQPLPETLLADLATGYTLNGDTLTAGGFEYMNLYPNGALSTTAEDMARFAITQLSGPHDSAVLSARGWTEMQTRQFGNLPQVSGLTFGFEQSRWNGHTAFGHGGDIAHFKTHFMMFGESRISIFIAFNSDHTGNAGAEIIAAFADRYLPGEENFLFSTAPVDDATDDIEGAFVSTRRNASTLEKLYWPLATSVNITRISDAEIDVQFFGAHRRYVRQAEGVYVPAPSELGASDGFGALIARRSQGQTQIAFTQIGSFMFERAPAGESLSLHGTLLFASLASALLGGALGIAGAIGFGKRRSVAIVAACASAAAAACMAIAFVPLIMESFTPELVYGVSGSMRALFWLPLIAGGLGAASLLLLILAWRKQRPHVVQIASVVLVCAGLAVFLWQLSVWNMLGFGGLPA